jgi:uncharacterized protein involved in exopolysaccharide biosynthesis/Mrp family chromosome partitioning ATPase
MNYMADNSILETSIESLRLASPVSAQSPGLLNTFLRAKWFILTSAVIGGLLVGVLGLYRATLYEAKAQLFVSTPAPILTSNGPIAVQESFSEVIDGHLTVLSSYAQMNRVAAVLREKGNKTVLEQLRKSGHESTSMDELFTAMRYWQAKLKQALDLNASPPEVGEQVSDNDIIDALKTGIRVGQELRSRVVSVGFTHQDPVLASEVANIFAQSYVDHLTNQSRASAERDLANLEARLPAVRADFSRSVEAKEKFAEVSNLAVGKTSDATVSTLANLRRLHATVEKQLAETGQPGNPENDAAIQDRQYLLKQNETLKSQISEFEMEAANSASRTAGLLYLELEADADSKRLNEILSRSDTLRLRVLQPTPQVSFFSSAYPPREPRTLPAVVLVPPGMLFFGIMAFALAVFRRSSDHTLRGEAESENYLGVPSVGLMPIWKRAGSADFLNLVTEMPQSRNGRAASSILANVVPGDLAAKNQFVIVVTASKSGEAKTELAWSLALIAVRSGYRVHFHDLDTTQHPLTRSMELVDKLESGFIFMESPAELSTVTDEGARNIVFIPSLADRKSSRHFTLAGTAMRNFRDENGDDAVIVVVNAPPVGIVPEVRSIIGQADAVIFAVEWGATDRNVARAALQVMTRSKTNSGSIKTSLTNVNLRKQKSFASGDAGDFLRI